MKQQCQLYVCLLAKNNLNDTRKRNLFQILRVRCVCVCVCVCVYFFSTTNGRVEAYNISQKNNISQKMSNLEIIFLKNSSDIQIGLGLRPPPILAVLGIVSSNYFQVGQHIVLLYIQIRPSILALNPKPRQKYFNYTHRPKSRPNLKQMNSQSAAIAGSGNPLKSRLKSENRAKIFSNSTDPFTYSLHSI